MFHTNLVFPDQLPMLLDLVHRRLEHKKVVSHISKPAPQSPASSHLDPTSADGEIKT